MPGSQAPWERKGIDMPQLYNNVVMTAAGAALLDKAQAGQAQIQFTRMAVGNGTYTAEEKLPSALQERTGLRSSKNSYTLSSANTVPGGGIKLTAVFTNQDPATGGALVNEGYHINEIGLFAKEKDGADDTEVLYSIAVATGDNGDYMPPYNGGAPVQIIQEYRAKISGAAEVSINSVGAFMLAEDAEREFASIKEMVDGAGGGPIEDETPTFEEAQERENIASGDTLGTILGKAKKIFAGLKTVAFTGNYDDLINKPTAADLGITSIQGTATLSTEWAGEEAPFTQTVAVPGVKDSSIIDIDVAGTVTAEQLDAYINAKIIDGGQSENSITLKAFGEKPAVTIPLRVVVRRV